MRNDDNGRGQHHTRDTLIAKDENQAMFDEIARRYDLMNRLISLGLDKSWRKKAIQTLGPKADGLYLDIGAGTGDLSYGLAKAQPTAKVIGLDPSFGMLTFGKKKARDAAIEDRVTFTMGDAMALPFSDNRFDGVILGFCIRNVENRAGALGEMQRVLKPGGRLTILELTTPEHGLQALLHKIHTTTTIPAAARLLSLSRAYSYLVRSVRAFPVSSEFDGQVQAAGFVATSFTPLTFGTATIFTGVKPK